LTDTPYQQGGFLRFAAWLLFALLFHWLLLSCISLPEKTGNTANTERQPVVEITLVHPLLASASPAWLPDQGNPPPEKPMPSNKSVPVRQSVNNSDAERLQAVVSSPSASKRKPLPEVTVNRLKQAIYDYKLPEHDDQELFTPVIPSGIAEESFSINGMARLNYRAQEYSHRGGARIYRTRKSGDRERCYLVYKRSTELELADWDPGMVNPVGIISEEIECD
jgi:hypothetical protein